MSVRKRLFTLILIAAAFFGVYKYMTRYTKTEEVYTLTVDYYLNDELQISHSKAMNKYDDPLSIVSEHYSYTPEQTYKWTESGDRYYYKYDRHGNMTRCVCKESDGDTISKEVLKYDRNGNCVLHKKTDSDGSYIEKNEYSDKGLKILSDTELHDLKENWHSICHYYYDENDRLIKEENSVFSNKTYEYDDNGQLAVRILEGDYRSPETHEYYEEGLIMHKEEYNSDGSLCSETTYEYNENSQLICSKEITYREEGDDTLAENRYTYDDKGNKTSEIRIYDGKVSEKIIYGYDEDSHMISQSEYRYSNR